MAELTDKEWEEQLSKLEKENPEIYKALMGLSIAQPQPQPQPQAQISSTPVPQVPQQLPVLHPQVHQPTPFNSVQSTLAAIQSGANGLINQQPYACYPQRPTPSWIPLAIFGAIGGGLGLLGLALIVQAIVGSSPTSIVAKSQDAQAAMFVSAMKETNRPNVNCFMAVHCPQSGSESAEQGDRGVQLTSPTMNVQVAPATPAGVNADLYQQWVQYWTQRSNQQIANYVANDGYTPENCNKTASDQAMCAAVEFVKQSRGM